MSTDKAMPTWKIPDWMRGYIDCIVNTGGGDVEEMVNGNADPRINLPLSTLQACVKSQVGLLAKMNKHGLLPNPKRDQLARELAEKAIKEYEENISDGCKCCEGYVCSSHSARQLLKLYEEEK